MAHDSTTQLQRWVERLQAGDASARDQLIGHACERLRRLTRAMLKGYQRLKRWEDTDDVFQSAAMRLLRALEATTPASVADFFRLAAQQIRRELIDLTRHYYGPRGPGARQVRESERDPGPADAADPGLDKPDTTYEPSRLAIWSEFHAQVEALPAEERDVFDLVWYQGLSQAEAAPLLGVSYATVKRRWVAARLHLQEALRQGGPAW